MVLEVVKIEVFDLLSEVRLRKRNYIDSPLWSTRPTPSLGIYRRANEDILPSILPVINQYSAGSADWHSNLASAGSEN